MRWGGFQQETSWLDQETDVRKWSGGNLGGGLRSGKQTGEKNVVYLFNVAVHTAQTIIEKLKKSSKRER